MINYIMKQTLQKIVKQCGCIDIKVVIFLFFLMVIIYSMYGDKLKEDCDCD